MDNKVSPGPNSPTSWNDADTALLEQIYELQCLSRMNAIYYELRLSRVQLINTTLDIFIALTASGSGLATLLSSADSPFKHAWTALAVLAAIAAIIKPIYAPGKMIEAFTRQQHGYLANYFALKKLSFAVRQEGGVTPEHRKRHDTFYDRHVQLSAEDEATPHEKCRQRAREMIDKELPPERFWWPADVAGLQSHDQ